MSYHSFETRQCNMWACGRKYLFLGRFCFIYWCILLFFLTFRKTLSYMKWKRSKLILHVEINCCHRAGGSQTYDIAQANTQWPYMNWNGVLGHRQEWEEATVDADQGLFHGMKKWGRELEKRCGSDWSLDSGQEHSKAMQDNHKGHLGLRQGTWS